LLSKPLATAQSRFQTRCSKSSPAVTSLHHTRKGAKEAVKLVKNCAEKRENVNEINPTPQTAAHLTIAIPTLTTTKKDIEIET